MEFGVGPRQRPSGSNREQMARVDAEASVLAGGAEVGDGSAIDGLAARWAAFSALRSACRNPTGRADAEPAQQQQDAASRAALLAAACSGPLPAVSCLSDRVRQLYCYDPAAAAAAELPLAAVLEGNTGRLRWSSFARATVLVRAPCSLTPIEAGSRVLAACSGRPAQDMCPPARQLPPLLPRAAVVAAVAVDV